MPELRFETNIYGELTKGNWFNMNTEHKGANMAFSGTRALLMWCRQQTESYGEVNVINMTTSWRDGLAFCAIVHRFRPDLIDFDRLTKENIMENNELAFSMAEKHFGIPMVLDASDMVENTIPDRLSVITYVSQLYEYFKNRTPANQGYATKMNIQPKARAESKGHKGSKRASPSNQMYILSGHAKRVATALRNVFKSDPKEEPSKGKEHGHSSKYSGVDTMRTSLETSSRNSDEPSPSNTARKSPFLGNDCCICHSKVYIMERLIAERKLFHRACFRCDKCNACLRPGTYHYFPETDKFRCLFDCAGGQREMPIKIKLEPITNVAQEPHSPNTLSSKTSTGDPHLTDSPQQGKSSLQRQFSVVKRNTITLNALPQPSTQGNTNIALGPKHLHSSKSPTLSRHKGEGEKKRRFSGSGRVKSKREGKEKFVREPGDQGKTSWSPEHKRRAPEIRLENVTDDVTDGSSNKHEISKASLASSPKLYLLSSEEQVHVVVEANEEGLFSLRKTEGTKIAREDSMYEPPTENLFFSFKEELLKRAAFKEELLKRATQDEANDANDDNEVTNENKLLESDCKQGLRTTSQEKVKTGKDYDVEDESDFSGNYVENGDGNLTEENVMTADERKCSHERRHSEDSSVKSDSTKGSGSRKGSILDEVAPVVPKSVQKLREKFLNISDIIDDKHRTNIAKKSSTVKRELRCVSAWKQQTDSHVATTRKLSANLAGKSAETRRPNIGSNRKSVKELRKMYMGSGGSDDKASKGNFNRMQSQSTKESETKEISSESSQGEPENLSDSETKEIESETKDDSAPSAAVYETEEVPSEGNECYDANDQIVVIHVDPSQGERQDEVAVKVINESLLSSQQNSTMSHETRTYTIIKSGDVPYNVPSLQIQPSSPESCNSEQRSPGLKRHAASHDSGIDMPSYAQNNVLTAVRDEKISAESLKVAAEFSFPGSGSSVLTPSEQPSNVTGSDLQSPDISLSPGSDFSPEVFWSLPLSVGNRASLTDTSSSCSSPRMSVIIAQEASTTKINSRFFTVESMEPWDFEDHRIAEEHQCVMEVEGEFYFGREKRRISRAEREAIFSLHREAKNHHGFKATELIKEEEITLSPSEIDSELQALEAKHGILERRGVEIEHSLRESMDSEGPFNDCEDELLREWLSVVHERNKIMRRESELIYLLQSHNYEERYRTVEGELRKLVAMRDEVKSNDDLKKERGLLSELLELVQKRSFIVDSLEEERVREIQEDEKVEQALTDGIAALPGNCWDQRPDCTKVAFSRFYC